MLLPCVILSAMLSASPDNDDDAAAALALHAARVRTAESIASVQYSTMRLQALASNQPLVVGVGCEPPQGSWLTVRWDGFPISEGMPCIVVAQPKGGDLIWLVTLPKSSQSSDVRFHLGQLAGKTPVGYDYPVGGGVNGPPGVFGLTPTSPAGFCVGGR